MQCGTVRLTRNRCCCVIVSRLNLVLPAQGSGSMLKFVASCDCRPLGRDVAPPDVPYSTERCAARQIADAFERIAALDAPVTPSPPSGSQQPPVSESSSSSMVCSWPHDVHRHVAPSSKAVFLPVIRPAHLPNIQCGHAVRAALERRTASSHHRGSASNRRAGMGGREGLW